ncbi:hypothetical protein [Pseudactinotalea sp. HY160]|uniref:hypothetical protein n=1 Tax=Pseudactinotalea sp. HY160 TaxID=2654490 RepID=UPI0018831E9F|nr:hypothetical protein [Pseudactinotalea sp. HY160]
MAASAAAMALAATVMAGCADGRGPGIAASVDGTVISAEEVDEGMALAPFYAQPPNPTAIVTNLIHASILLPVASDNGLGVSDEDAASFLDGLDAQSIQVDGEYTQPVLDLVRLSLAAEAANSAPQGQQFFGEVNERLATADITLSPRYGDWDEATAQPVAAARPWLVSPTPTQ